MQNNINTTTPKSSKEWYDLGVSYRQHSRFGDAVNAFQRAIETASDEVMSGSLSEEEAAILRSRASASIGLILEINSFVNTDLMNP